MYLLFKNPHLKYLAEPTEQNYEPGGRFLAPSCTRPLDFSGIVDHHCRGASAESLSFQLEVDSDTWELKLIVIHGDRR